MADIPFLRQMDFEYERLDQMSPLIQRVVANNPGPFTFTGTGVYIIGDKNVAVIDPGPDSTVHFAALQRALEGRRVTHILVTHPHMDHSPLAYPLARQTGAHIWAAGNIFHDEAAIPVEAGEDTDFAPDEILTDGQIIEGDGWTIEAIHTPGHTSNHYCFALKEENALFSGDHIMGWSTTVILPPDGHMGDYFNSLEKVRARNFDTIWPTHGPPIKDANAFIDAYIKHRRARETAILERLKEGDSLIVDMVKVIYADVDSRLHPAACHSVLAHILHLVEQNRVTANTDTPGLSDSYQLT